MSRSGLAVTGLCKTFNSGARPDTVLQNISFRLDQGEILALMGPSGCGKTTLLRIIAGLEPCSRGDITFRDSLPCRAGVNYIGFIFQTPVLFPWRTVKMNVLLAAQVGETHSRSYDSDAARKQASEMLRVVNLPAEYDDAYPRVLSGGMKQRVAVARALMRNPPIMLLDEPLSALDEKAREEMWVDLSRIWADRSLSAILVTHSIEEAVFLSDRILVLSRKPAIVKATVATSCKKPRDENYLDSAEYFRLCRDVRHALR
jgi:NitT/TauT family transport system ATP-binding protein